MLENDVILKVRNRENATVGYNIPDLGNLHRLFQPQEIKDITMEELRKLSYLPGGKYILENCLIVDDEEAIRELLGNVEPEYFYNEAEVKELLLRGSIEQLDDCLRFAPAGVIDLVKSLAVSLKINDLAKRNLIYEKTGFNISKAILINEESQKVEKEEVTRKAEPVSVRKAPAITNDVVKQVTKAARSAPPIQNSSKYRVVNETKKHDYDII